MNKDVDCCAVCKQRCNFMSNKKGLVKPVMGTVMRWQGKLYKQCDPSFAQSHIKSVAADTNMCIGRKRLEGNVQKYKQCLSSGIEMMSAFLPTYSILLYSEISTAII